MERQKREGHRGKVGRGLANRGRQPVCHRLHKEHQKLHRTRAVPLPDHEGYHEGAREGVVRRLLREGCAREVPELNGEPCLQGQKRREREASSTSTRLEHEPQNRQRNEDKDQQLDQGEQLPRGRRGRKRRRKHPRL